MSAVATKPLNRRHLRRELGLSMAAVYREIFQAHKHEIQVRNERIAVANLGKIIEATLAIANRQGFTAMRLRELAERAGLSLGGLYAYIRSKDDLVAMVQGQVQRELQRAMTTQLEDCPSASARLSAAIRVHLYLSEALRPWFQFLYMEARHLARADRRRAIAQEQAAETLFADIITQAQRAGEFRACDAHIAAGLLKAMLQDWYLKPRKHQQRGLNVAGYAFHVEDVITRYLSANPHPTADPEEHL